jgi:hypothetical protein
MDRHGKVLAKSHKIQKGNPVDKLLRRLEDNERTLLEVRNLLVESLRAIKQLHLHQNGCWIIFTS